MVAEENEKKAEKKIAPSNILQTSVFFTYKEVFKLLAASELTFQPN